MVRVRKREFERVVWKEFSRLHTEVEDYFEGVTDHLITRAMGSDGDDSTIDHRRLPGWAGRDVPSRPQCRPLYAITRWRH